MKVIVIIGGGYAGVICANRLRSSLTDKEASRVRIRLVNPIDRFVERIRLHEVAAGSRQSAELPLSELLHPDVEVVLGLAVHIDPANRLVDIRHDGEVSAIAYDRLVYAVGSGASTARVPGADRFAYAIADPASAVAAAAVIAGRANGDPAAGSTPQRIVVVGGGFTGVETASEVAEQRPDADVTLVTSGPIVAPMRARARRRIERTLARLGVTIEDRPFVTSVDDGALVFADGTSLRFDVCLWTASFGVPELARASGLACDRVGRLRVDEHLRSIDAPEILGAGDAVLLPDELGAHLRMGCAIALPLGGAAADTLLADLRGESLPVASAGFLVQCISLGRRDGYVQVVHADDRSTPVAFTGWAGARIKEAICRMTVDGPRKERTTPGAYWAPKGPKAPKAPKNQNQTPTSEPVAR
ncbi:NAD(P)/FAD-dependent oxidoreductase [Microbacterium sp.]|uniref:NAD(P)/FAD-dependent oxidoreductase n=1 Tax=Microbacterium sp. TaxID=51671 RepID=UPI003C752554